MTSAGRALTRLLALTALAACAAPSPPPSPPEPASPATAGAVSNPPPTPAAAPPSSSGRSAAGGGIRESEAGTPLRTSQAMVVSASTIASRIGAEVLLEGGNAVDAAIAVGFALAVTHPTAGNIGGGGFLVVRLPDGRATAFDFREKAPLAAHPRMFLDSAGEYSDSVHHHSHIAVGVPGTVAGFALAHERHGSLPWARLVRPAVALAAEGFAIPEGLATSLRNVLPTMQPYPASVAAFSRNGVPYEAGDVWQQPDLARTLERIARQGPPGFYRGETARLIAEEMRRNGGLITEEDLARYQARERAPLRGSYRGVEIISMPPPSSGGVAVIQMLNILEGYPIAALGHLSPSYIHHVVEAMRRAYQDRARYLADPDFADIPVGRLTSKEYAAELRATIDPARATPSSPSDIALAGEGPETTHYSVIDGSGMAVAVTYTLEYGYGSKIVVPGAGFLLNNEMGDFNPAPGLTDEDGLIGTEPNLARPEQRMLSNMTPTILAREGRVLGVVGSPGGRTIINTVLQMVLNLVDFGMDIQAAVDAPRFHHQWLPDRISFEPERFPRETLRELQAMGHAVRFGSPQGRVHAILVEAGSGERVGAADTRDSYAGAAGF